MTKFIFRAALVAVVVLSVVASINYYADPANLFRTGIIDAYAENLAAGNIVRFVGDIDERLLQKRIIATLDENKYNTYILGSSHVMYLPWQYEDYYCAGVSGAMLEDDIAIFGMIEDKDSSIERIIIGVDPWLFLNETGEVRYKSIEKEYKAELEKISGEKKNDKEIFSIIPPKCLELFSPAYLQSSVKSLIRHKGVGTLTVSKNAEPENINKTMPNGRRIMSTSSYFHSIEENTDLILRSIATDTVYHMKKNDSLNPDRIKIFEQFIDYLLAKGIELQFYLPSWSPVFYDEFKSNPEYHYFTEMENYVVEFATTKKIHVHGTYDPSVLGIIMGDYTDFLHLQPEVAFRLYNTIVR